MTIKAHIDEEITQGTALSVWSPCTGQRSTSSPVHRLSAEILQTIFLQYARDSYTNSFYSQRELGVPDWVNISYVCSHWRALALNYPVLWAYHFVASLRWTEELLARSRQVPLRISFEFGYEHSDSWYLSLLEKLMDHGERIQQLHMTLRTSTQTATDIHSKFPLFLPKLQHLVMLSAACEVFQCPLTFLDGNNLRTLELSHNLMSQCPPGLASLTTLNLRYLPSIDYLEVSVLLAILRDTQNLTHLGLYHSVLGDIEFIPNNRELLQKVNLPHLSQLSIYAPASTVVAMLSFLDFPSNTQVRLSCFTEDGSSREDYTELPSLLAQRFTTSEDQAVPSQAIRSLTIDFNDVGPTLVLSTSQHDYHPFVCVLHTDWDHNIPLKVFFGSLDRRQMEADVNSIMSDIFHAIPLTTVESVHFINPPSKPALWKVMLGHLPGLRYMKLSAGYMPHLLSVLSDQHDSGDTVGNVTEGAEDRGHPVLLPALEELQLHRITFPIPSNREGKLSRWDATVSRRAFFDALRSICPVRRVQVVMLECAIRKRRWRWWDTD